MKWKSKNTAKALIFVVFFSVVALVGSCGKSGATDPGTSTDTTFLPNPAL